MAAEEWDAPVAVEYDDGAELASLTIRPPDEGHLLPSMRAYPAPEEANTMCTPEGVPYERNPHSAAGWRARPGHVVGYLRREAYQRADDRAMYFRVAGEAPPR